MLPLPSVCRIAAIRIAVSIAVATIWIAASQHSLPAQGIDPSALQSDPLPAELADDRTRSAELSKRKYSSRQQATLEMWRRRDLSRDDVQQAARDPDPEVAGRAKWILRQWRRGSLPDTPPEISRLLQRSDDPAAIQELLEGGQFVAAVVAVEESAGTIDYETIQKRVNSALTRRFPVYIKAAIENDSLADLVKLIDLTADSKEMAVCRVQLMQQLGMPLDSSTLLPACSTTWTQDQRYRATVLVLTILGRMDEAVATAERSGDERLLRICQMLASQWKQMAIASAQLAREAESGSYEHSRLWCQALIASDRCDETAIFEEAASQLANTDTAEDELATELRWKCLAGHGQVDAALKILDQARPDAAAVVSVAASRGSRAFETLGFPLDRIDRDLEQWIEDAADAQRGSSDLAEPVRRMLSLMRCLLSIGRDDAAWTVASKMCDSDVDVGTIPLREYVLSTLTMTQHRDWVLRLATMAGQDSYSPTTQRVLVRTLTDVDSTTFEALMDSIAVLKPRERFDRRLRMAYQLLAGEPVDGFDTVIDGKRLFDHLTNTARQPQKFGGRGMPQANFRLNLTIVNMFATLGRADLATQCLQQLVESGNIEAILQVANRELDAGHSETANGLFDLIWQRIDGQRSGGFRSSKDDVDLAAEALVGQWRLAKRRGDTQLSDDLLAQLKLTLCSPSTETRNVLASFLGDRGELELAIEAYQSLLPMTAFGTPEATGFYQVAWKFSRLARDVDVIEAARWYDLAGGGTLESTDYRSVAYITLPLDVRRWSLEAAIERNDLAEAQRHVKRIQQLDPLDIDSAERLLPMMREKGMKDLADATFNKIIDRGLEHAQMFPFDATSCNNLAWVAAMNGQRLEDALTLSRMAVYVEPESAIFRDTLAEVLFQLGRKEEALQVEQSCVLDDPSQWHLHQQIKKYRDAVETDS